MKIVLFAVLGMALVGAGCTETIDNTASTPQRDDRITRLEVEGFTDISVNQGVLFSCGEDDSVLNSYSFKAKKNGHDVEGVVCCGWFKACTVRY